MVQIPRSSFVSLMGIVLSTGFGEFLISTFDDFFLLLLLLLMVALLLLAL